jgi:hypothetical protein
MKHKIEINIASEDIEIIENILQGQCNEWILNSLTLEDAVVLGILKQAWYKLQEREDTFYLCQMNDLHAHALIVNELVERRKHDK